ncbi:MAG TPA: carbon storage regulator CsrA [Bacilli bacterium]
MLVLSRKINESIMFGDDIEIVVLSITGDTVKLGISAPRQVDVYRKEIYELIQQSNKEASQNTVTAEDLGKIFRKKE